MRKILPLLILFVTFGCNMRAATHDHGLGAARSSGWAKVRAAYIKSHPNCEACGQPAEEIHHLTPFARDPARELDPNNLIALCHHDHLLIGHGDNYRTFNPDAKEDAAKMLKMIRDIKAKRLDNKP